jgi:hypothetical protein
MKIRPHIASRRRNIIDGHRSIDWRQFPKKLANLVCGYQLSLLLLLLVSPGFSDPGDPVRRGRLISQALNIQLPPTDRAEALVGLYQIEPPLGYTIARMFYDNPYMSDEVKATMFSHLDRRLGEIEYENLARVEYPVAIGFDDAGNLYLLKNWHERPSHPDGRVYPRITKYRKGADGQLQVDRGFGFLGTAQFADYPFYRLEALTFRVLADGNLVLAGVAQQTETYGKLFTLKVDPRGQPVDGYGDEQGLALYAAPRGSCHRDVDMKLAIGPDEAMVLVTGYESEVSDDTLQLFLLHLDAQGKRPRRKSRRTATHVRTDPLAGEGVFVVHDAHLTDSAVHIVVSDVNDVPAHLQIPIGLSHGLSSALPAPDQRSGFTLRDGKVLQTTPGKNWRISISQHDGPQTDPVAQIELERHIYPISFLHEDALVLSPNGKWNLIVRSGKHASGLSVLSTDEKGEFQSATIENLFQRNGTCASPLLEDLQWQIIVPGGKSGAQ